MRQHIFRFFAGDGDHQLAFIGEVQGVQPEQLADPAHGVVDRQLRLVQFNAAAAGDGELMGDGVDAAAGGVAQGFDAAQRPQGLISGVSTAQSLDSAPSSPICSRRLRMVAP